MTIASPSRRAAVRMPPRPSRGRAAVPSRIRVQGRTLLEVLVALAIGSVVLGAVLVAVTGSGLTGR